jgi:hypothetical protein
MQDMKQTQLRAQRVSIQPDVRYKERSRAFLNALRRQQGRYMGLVRRLTEAEKARVRGLREKKGLPAAIRLALSLGRS